MSEILTESVFLRLRIDEFAALIEDESCKSGLSPHELVELCGFAEAMTHRLKSIIDTVSDPLQMEDDSPSACRAWERLCAAAAALPAVTLLLEHSAESLRDFSNTRPSGQ